MAESSTKSAATGPGPSPSNKNNIMSTSPSKTAPNNPYLKMKTSSSPAKATPSPKVAAAAPSPSAAVASAATPPGKSTLITPEQRAKMEANRKRAIERRVTSLLNQEPNKKARREANACLRCGSHDKNSLCIKWNHDGDIERERARGMGPYGRDAFRYSCCGRCAPNPCFVGRHAFADEASAYGRHTLGGSRNVVIQCDCHNGPARLVETKKEGPNQGRYFFRCSSDREKDCDFFMWADAAFNLPPQRRQKSGDGIKEWVHIYANPFGQQLNWMEMTASMMPTTQAILHERLLAAILMHECVTSVAGGPWVCAMPHLEDFVEKIQKLFNMKSPINRNASLLKDFLYPLTRAQVARRFGVSFEENDPLFDKAPALNECRDILAKAAKEHSVLRAAGVKVETVTRPEISRTLIDLGGLEEYFAV